MGAERVPDFGIPCHAPPARPAVHRVDAHLRSTQSVSGYQLGAKDGTIGHVCDFMVDDRSWAIQQLVIKTGHRFTGKEVQIPVSHVDRISYEESTVFVNLTTVAVEQSPARELAHAGAIG